MPDHPYVYGASMPPPVEPGGTRLRVFRRRRQGRGEEAGGESGSERREEANDAAWRELLEDAVAELNRAFAGSGVPFECLLEEEEHSLSLLVRRTGADGGGEPVEEEVLEPSELPHWLARLRTRLGLLVDETA